VGISLGIVMDPIGDINIKKDSSLRMLLEAQARGWCLEYMELQDLFLRDGRCHARRRGLAVRDDPAGWFEFLETRSGPLSELDVVLMRKDPPFDMEFIYATYLLERAEAEGLAVINRPGSLRDANEKVFTAWFPECCPPTLVTRSLADLQAFLDEQQTIVLKPLDGMGGVSIFKVSTDDPNRNVIFETLTAQGTRFAMAQRFLPEITEGDKRILMIAGEPVDYGLARIPTGGDIRGNLAAQAKGVGVPLTDRERWICAQVGPELVRRGLVFVGLDVIGGYLTEINVTSPTCIRELEDHFGINIAGQLLDAVAGQLSG